jgi:Ca2+-binding RTX toxin-like protein
MIIDIKGTKTTATEVDPAQAYNFKKPENNSNGPLYFGLFLGGIAIYFRSIFSGSARAEEAAPIADEGLGGAAQPDTDMDVAAAVDKPHHAGPAAKGSPAPMSEKLLSASPAIATLPIEPFMLAEPHPLQFTTANNKPDLEAFKTSPVIPLPTNDNGGAGSGSGGGGGGLGRRPGAANANAERDQDAIAKDTLAGAGDAPDEPDGDDDDERPTPIANRAPRVAGPVFLRDVVGSATLAIVLADLLRMAEDPDGDALSVRNVRASSGTLTQRDDGWVYAGDGVGPVTLTYEITDGALSVQQTASFSVLKQPPVIGDDAGNVLLGSTWADEIDGKGGDDSIDARAGRDVIDGGTGDDRIVAGDGDDVVFGGEGDDIVFGGAGQDYISGGSGNDRLFGEAGDDVIFGDAGNDFLSGGDGADLLFGGSGDDLVYGGAGNDLLEGGEGDDVLEGGEDNDVLRDGGGSDVVQGSAGNDVVLVSLDREDDSFDGGDGFDTLDYSESNVGVSVDLAAGTASAADAAAAPPADTANNTVPVSKPIGSSGGDPGVSVNPAPNTQSVDIIAGFEKVIGSSGDDALTGSDDADQLFGGKGNDAITGADGDDLLEGGEGDDILRDGKGSDAVRAGAGSDVVHVSPDGEDDSFDGEAGLDTLDYSESQAGVSVDLAAGSASGADIGEDTIAGFEKVIGSAGADALTGSDDADQLYGSAGDDVLRDGKGSDEIHAGADDDTVVATLDAQDDCFDGGAGSDTLDYSSATGNLVVDLVAGTAQGQDIGTDTIAGFECVAGGDGNDRFVIGEAPVTLSGGGGENEFVFTAPASALASEEPAIIMHEIVDFKPNDLIRMSKYDIFEKVFNELDTQFEAIYDERIDQDEVGIRYRQELVDGIDRTIIEADLDSDQVYETTISMHGNHALVIVEHTPTGA